MKVRQNLPNPSLLIGLINAFDAPLTAIYHRMEGQILNTEIVNHHVFNAGIILKFFEI